MKKYIFLLALLSFSSTVYAEKLTIDSDNSLKWYKDEQKIVANGNAVARKKDNFLKGDTLTAYYEKVQLEDETQKNQIQKIISYGHVKLETPDSKGEGVYFEYNLPLKTAVFKGNPARLENKMGEISATESITYYGAENKSIAIGDVIAHNPDYTVYADKMISYFDEDKNGKKRLNRVEIFATTKPVKIINDQATVTGQRGTYFPIENKLKIFENVTINQKGDILKGDFAETDLNTGISRLIATKKNSRVTGLFHNKKKK